MAQHIDRHLKTWPYDPQSLSVRRLKGADGREVLQMRVDLGILQLEVNGRPDGTRPHGCATYFDYLLTQADRFPDGLELSEEQCREVDREFVQYYHRRICWLRLQDYRRAVSDAQHTLALMAFCREHSDDEQWILSHEQYRPFVLLHRVQSQALHELEGGEGVGAAVEAIDQGLEEMHAFFVDYGAEERFDEDEIVIRLREFRESLQEQFDDRFKLKKELEAAVAAEEYERAARLRDELNQLGRGQSI
jgi:hypothetical protein